MRIPILLPALLLCSVNLFAQTEEKRDPATTEIWNPKPKKVTPGSTCSEAPSDAIILFDGKDLSKWVSAKEGEAKWEVKDGAFTVVKGTGAIKTKQTFGDIQLHIEFREPLNETGTGQGRGNSGVFLAERYEIQILDTYENATYVNGQAGAIYKQHIPLVNATRKAGEWQAYDVVFNAPRFSESGNVTMPANVTVFHNGIVVQNNRTIFGSTDHLGLPVYVVHGKASLLLQDHGNPVSFRNVWVREL